MHMNRYDIVPAGLWWKLTYNGVNLGTHFSQDQAYDAARHHARMVGGGEISIHGKDGRIREKNTISPANDPRHIRG